MPLEGSLPPFWAANSLPQSAQPVKIVRTARPCRRFRGVGIYRVGNARQQGENGDDHENFNERETFAA